MRPVIQTYTGVFFNLMEPRPEDVRIEDIAHALSLTPRFNGHTAKPYFVSQHSVHVAQLLPPEYQMVGLMHDAAEAYIGDITSPLKFQLPQIKGIERRIHDAVCEALGIPKGKPQKVHDADMTMLVTEARDLMAATSDTEYWRFEGYEPLPTSIFPLHSSLAKDLFLSKYRELKAREDSLDA